MELRVAPAELRSELSTVRAERDDLRIRLDATQTGPTELCADHSTGRMKAMSGGVLYDSFCGEPIAWARVGEPVIGQEWTEHGRMAITERLSPADAVRKYGPVTEVVLGRNGGFKSVTYGATKFFSRFVDPQGTGLDDNAAVVV
ncbi:hypothetical protein B2J88_50530 [Rhodococcus sp. SRB_17]|nr:hypothetical protein [Rhodococcus sp. SRB_17]